MNNRQNSTGPPNQSQETPPLLRMLHPTSGREGFNDINTQTFPSRNYMDPAQAMMISRQTQQAMMINRQTQQAINASGVYPTYPSQGFMYYNYTPQYYNVPEAYRFFLTRQ